MAAWGCVDGLGQWFLPDDLYTIRQRFRNDDLDSDLNGFAMPVGSFIRMEIAV